MDSSHFYQHSNAQPNKHTYIHNVVDDTEHENTHKELPSISLPRGCSEYKALGIFGEALRY